MGRTFWEAISTLVDEPMAVFHTLDSSVGPRVATRDHWPMPAELPPELLDSQGHVIARRQSDVSRVSPDTMRNRLRDGRWQRMQRGVYAPFTGQPGRESELWAALLRVGGEAWLSHQTAAERHGLLMRPSELIHVTVPVDRHPARWNRIPGIVVHRSRNTRALHPAMSPPCTRIEDTVLDLIEASPTFDAGYRWIATAVGSRITTPDRIRQVLQARSRFRWRRETLLALGDADSGILSWLERVYFTGVERRHTLPRATRQARVLQYGRGTYLDNLYESFGVCVELDGTAAHPATDQWKDKRRDNFNLVRQKIVTLRFGFLDLRTRDRQCQSARYVAELLTDRGLNPATIRSCSGACVLADMIAGRKWQ